ARSARRSAVLSSSTSSGPTTTPRRHEHENHRGPKDRTALNTLLDPPAPRYVTGSPEDRKRARDEWHRHKYIAEVMRSPLEEIPRADISHLPFGVAEDTRTGDFYPPRHDGVVDLNWTSAVAYYIDAAGTPVLLERPASGP